jgi:hypothetical protein
MASNNVIVFPKNNINIQKSTTMEEIQHNVEMMHHYHIQETIANMAPMIFNQLEIAGFFISDEEVTDIKDGAFIIESLRSVMCKYYDIYHPFQLISENVFEEDKREDGALRIAEKIDLVLKKNETKQV